MIPVGNNQGDCFAGSLSQAPALVCALPSAAPAMYEWMPQLTETAPAMPLTIIVKVPVIHMLLHHSSVVWHLASIAYSKAVGSELTSPAAGASPEASSDCMPSSEASKHARNSLRHHMCTKARNVNGFT